jgi:hypothetical protein
MPAHKRRGDSIKPLQWAVHPLGHPISQSTNGGFTGHPPAPSMTGSSRSRALGPSKNHFFKTMEEGEDEKPAIYERHPRDMAEEEGHPSSCIRLDRSKRVLKGTLIRGAALTPFSTPWTRPRARRCQALERRRHSLRACARCALVTMPASAYTRPGQIPEHEQGGRTHDGRTDLCLEALHGGWSFEPAGRLG